MTEFCLPSWQKLEALQSIAITSWDQPRNRNKIFFYKLSQTGYWMSKNIDSVQFLIRWLSLKLNPKLPYFISSKYNHKCLFWNISKNSSLISQRYSSNPRKGGNWALLFTNLINVLHSSSFSLSYFSDVK